MHTDGRFGHLEKDYTLGRVVDNPTSKSSSSSSSTSALRATLAAAGGAVTLSSRGGAQHARKVGNLGTRALTRIDPLFKNAGLTEGVSVWRVHSLALQVSTENALTVTVVARLVRHSFSAALV
jgi:hypothetical protein